MKIFSKFALILILSLTVTVFAQNSEDKVSTPSPKSTLETQHDQTGQVSEIFTAGNHMIFVEEMPVARSAKPELVAAKKETAPKASKDKAAKPKTAP